MKKVKFILPALLTFTSPLLVPIFTLSCKDTTNNPQKPELPGGSNNQTNPGNNQNPSNPDPGNNNQNPGGNSNPQINDGGILTNPPKLNELKSYSYEELLNLDEKSLYKLSSHNHSSNEIDVTSVVSKYNRKYALNSYSSTKIDQSKIKEMYDETFEKVYQSVEEYTKYWTLIEERFTNFKNSDYDLYSFFSPYVNKVINDVETLMEKLDSKFRELLEQNNQSLLNELKTKAATIVNQAKSAINNNKNKKEIKAFKRLINLVPEKGHNYFEKDKEQKLSKLKMYQTHSDSYLEKLRKIVSEHSEDRYKLEYDLKYNQEFNMESDPNWFAEYISQFENPNKPFDNDTKWWLMHAVAHELELSRYIYKAMGEGWNIDFSLLNEYNPLDPAKNNNKYYVDVEKGFKWTTSSQKWKELKEYIINKLNQIIDDRWTDLQKAEAVHNYILWRYNYATNSEVKKYKNSQGYSLADPYNIVSGGNVVCDGYARTYALFMYFLNIPTRYYGGKGELNGSEELHAWNEVYLDINGKKGWYPVDLTWNDGKTKSGIDYNFKYFLKDDYFRDSHMADPLFRIFYSDKATPLK
ncbi:transglutaminase domain-containing protein [Mycoplasmopsis lipophila]|uniref:transglutaminase domain-containing protein n=1 Tax=Mycoplasmopsis lipophila TaxID=2117 RepID=UPI003872D7B8